jgi:hypothetical protein
MIACDMFSAPFTGGPMNPFSIASPEGLGYTDFYL